jgi:hypothetical protein
MLMEGEVASASGDATEIEYRKISPLAIVTVGLGLCSSLVLAHVLMWWLPIVTALVATAALRSIDRNPSGLTGKRLAIVGLCLSLFFFAWAVSRLVISNRVAKTQAQEIASKWLTIIREGDYYLAHQWVISTYRRQRGNVSLSEFYNSNADAKKDFLAFDRKVVQDVLKGFDDGDRFEFRKAGAVRGDDARRVVEVFFDVYPDGGAARPLSIQVERRVDSDMGVAMWQILSAAIAE